MTRLPAHDDFDTGRFALSVLTFPVAPIAVIYTVIALCHDIFIPFWYAPGTSDGQAIIGIAAILIPVLLTIIALFLGTLTLIGKWLTRRWPLGRGSRLALAVIRAFAVASATVLFVVAAAFFIGETFAFAKYWEVSVAWALITTTAIAFVVQQWRRVVSLWRASPAIDG